MGNYCEVDQEPPKLLSHRGREIDKEKIERVRGIEEHINC